MRDRPYTNLDGTTPDKKLGDVWRWMVADRIAGRRPRPLPFATPRRENDGAALAAREPHATWIGHATYALRLGGRMIVTDPVWSARIGPTKRNAPPGVPLEAMPEIDLVTISHAHYDHMDLPTLRRIAQRSPSCTFVVPEHNAEVLRAAGIARVVELAWWEAREMDGVRVTLVPAHHWSIRLPWDRNRRLWGGFVVEGPEGVAYHAGDTAWNEATFRAIAERVPRIDWAMIPIGAYEPVWFMSAQHIGPEDAGRAWELLGARRFLAMHWGTFRLTDEPLGEPPERIRAWFASRGHTADRLWVLDVGETRRLL